VDLDARSGAAFRFGKYQWECGSKTVRAEIEGGHRQPCGATTFPVFPIDCCFIINALGARLTGLQTDTPATLVRLA